MMLGADWLSWPDWATDTRRLEETDEASRIFLCCLIKTKSYNQTFFAHFKIECFTLDTVFHRSTEMQICVCTHV